MNEGTTKAIPPAGAETQGGRAPGPQTTPQPWFVAERAQQRFFEQVASAPQPLLICDYDGTLAPFQQDKMQAYPYPGVVERLVTILEGRTRLAFISGRPTRELLQLLPLANGVELWGMHGREHRHPDGTYHLHEPSAAQRAALDAAEAQLRDDGFAALLERKPASLAVHWRTLEGAAERLDQLRKRADAVFLPLSGTHGLALLPFDGGVELRAEDRTKAHAAEALLASGKAAAAAFLGDDTTDEDAFRVLAAAGGLSLLVREPARPSYASFSLRPPEELLGFLDQWLAAAGGSSRPPLTLESRGAQSR